MNDKTWKLSQAGTLKGLESCIQKGLNNGKIGSEQGLAVENWEGGGRLGWINSVMSRYSEGEGSAEKDLRKEAHRDR